MLRNLLGTTTESPDTLDQGRARAAAWQQYLHDQIAELETLLGDALTPAAMPQAAFPESTSGTHAIGKGLVLLGEES